MKKLPDCINLIKTYEVIRHQWINWQGKKIQVPVAEEKTEEKVAYLTHQLKSRYNHNTGRHDKGERPIFQSYYSVYNKQYHSLEDHLKFVTKESEDYVQRIKDNIKSYENDIKVSKELLKFAVKELNQFKTGDYDIEHLDTIPKDYKPKE